MKNISCAFLKQLDVSSSLCLVLFGGEWLIFVIICNNFWLGDLITENNRILRSNDHRELHINCVTPHVADVGIQLYITGHAELMNARKRRVLIKR